MRFISSKEILTEAEFLWYVTQRVPLFLIVFTFWLRNSQDRPRSILRLVTVCDGSESIIQPFAVGYLTQWGVQDVPWILHVNADPTIDLVGYGKKPKISAAVYSSGTWINQVARGRLQEDPQVWKALLSRHRAPRVLMHVSRITIDKLLPETIGTLEWVVT